MGLRVGREVGGVGLGDGAEVNFCFNHKPYGESEGEAVVNKLVLAQS